MNYQVQFLNQLLMMLNFCKPLKDSVACGRTISTDTFHENFGHCVDKLMDTFNIVLDEAYGDITIGDYNYTYSVMFGGALYLSDGTLTLPYIYRGGPIKFDIMEQTLVVEIPLLFKDFAVNYNYRSTLIGIPASGELKGVVDGLHGVFIGVYNNETCDFVANTTITNIGTFDIAFYKPMVLDWFLSLLSDAVVYIMKTTIITNAQNALNNFLQEPLMVVNKHIKVLHRMPVAWTFLERLAGEGEKSIP